MKSYFTHTQTRTWNEMWNKFNIWNALKTPKNIVYIQSCMNI